jgi:hypothetical protein
VRVFTVGEIAERIKGADEDLSAVVYRLQNWTDQGIIKTINQGQSGTGRRRLYSEDMLVDAFLLDHFTKTLDSPAVDAARKYEKYLKLIRYHLLPPKKAYLIMGLTTAKEAFAIGAINGSELASTIRDLDYDTFIILDLKKLAAKLSPGD